MPDFLERYAASQRFGRARMPRALGPDLGLITSRARPAVLPARRQIRGHPSRVPRGRRQVRYLVDSASSHMLVSKIKPCMSKYKQIVR